MPGPIRRLRSGLLAWLSRYRWLRFRCQPAIWRIGSAGSTSSFARRFLAHCTSLALALVSWKHLSIPQFAPLREGNRALAAVAAIFERHHPIFHFDDPSIPLIYLLLFIGASARTFSWAARSSFFPTLVPRDAFANAVTWNNSIFQIGSVVGPALSGLLVAYVGFPFVYLLDALCSFAFFLLVLTDPPQQAKKRPERREHLEKSHGRAAICVSAER